jgi:hypothetical protein
VRRPRRPGKSCSNLRGGPHLVALFVLSLAACRTDRPADSRARDLSRLLEPVPRDSAAQRADSQFQTCLYVYNSEEKIRECLVVKNGWTASDAARAIGVYKAQLARMTDSLLRAEGRRRDSLYLLKDLLDGPPARTYPDSGAWMADDRTGGYYRTTCAAARRIPVSHRVYFTTEEDAQAADLWRSGQPGCRFANWKQKAIAESTADVAKYAGRNKRLRADSLQAASFPVWGSKGSKLYFSSSPACGRVAILPDWDRALFKTSSEAEEAGFTPYDTDPACRVRQ